MLLPISVAVVDLAESLAVAAVAVLAVVLAELVLLALAVVEAEAPAQVVQLDHRQMVLRRAVAVAEQVAAVAAMVKL
jgi:hypothetical protein